MQTCNKCHKPISKYTLVCPNCNEKTEVTLKDLVVMLQNKDVNALEEIMRATQNTLMFHARSYVKDETDAKDIVQNAYIKAYNKIDTVNPEKFLGWIKQIVANEALNFMNSAHERYNVSFTDLERSDEEGNVEGFEAVDESIEANPEMKYAQSEKERMLFAILDSLPDKQRVVIIKSYYEDMKIKDIAKELSINENTVKTLIRRAKSSIKEAVENLQNKEGIKLYGLSPFPFFLWLLKSVSEVETVSYILSIPVGVITAAAVSSSTATTSAAVAGGILSTLGGKIAAGALVTTLAVSGGAAIHNNIQESKNEAVIEEHIHNYEIIETIEATLDKEGKIVYKCEGCDDSYFETIARIEPALAQNKEDIMKEQEAFGNHVRLGHGSWSEYVQKEATCEEPGILVVKCNECDYFFTEEIEKLYGKACNIDIPEHECVYVLTHIINPTCYEEGWRIYDCKTCGDSRKESWGYLHGPFCPIESGRHVHDFSVLIGTDEPTCDGPGANHYKCSYSSECNETYSEYIPQLYYGCEVKDEHADEEPVLVDVDPSTGEIIIIER